MMEERFCIVCRGAIAPREPFYRSGPACMDCGVAVNAGLAAKMFCLGRGIDVSSDRHAMVRLLAARSRT